MKHLQQRNLGRVQGLAIGDPHFKLNVPPVLNRKIMSINSLLLLITCGLVSIFGVLPSAHAGADSSELQARVYFLDWDTLTRGRMTPDDIKKLKDVYMEIRNQSLIEKILDQVKKLKCKKFTQTNIGDTRFVMELLDGSTIIESIYANKEHIELSGNRICENNSEFRRLLNVF